MSQTESVTKHLGYDSLKAMHRDLRDGFPLSLSLRTHRALSWLQRAEQETDDDDACFVFLWIAFNAAYANDLHDRQRFTERKLLLGFLGRLIDADTEGNLYHAIWDNFSGSIRVLVNNQYVFQPFWDFQSGKVDEETWSSQFERSKVSVARAMSRMNTKKVMAVMFDRLYTLRNQLVHGGATWNSSVNRDQIADGVQILKMVVPLLILLMMQQPNQLWGDPCYPVVE